MMDSLTQRALDVFYSGCSNDGVSIAMCGSEISQSVTAHHDTVLRVIQGGLSERPSHVVVPAGFGTIDMSTVNNPYSGKLLESSLSTSLTPNLPKDKPDRS